MNVIELEGEKKQHALFATKLDIQVASVLPGRIEFFAAHGPTQSFYVLVDKRKGDDEMTTVWMCEGEPEGVRRDMAERIRTRFCSGSL